MESPAGTDSLNQKPTRVRWIIFSLCCATSFLLYVHRYTWGFVKNEIGKEYNLDEVTLGWLDSAFMGPYAFGQIPGGMLGDWFGPRAVLTAIILLWSLALGATALPGGLWTIWSARTSFGLMQAGCYPNLGKSTKAWFPASSRTAIQGWIATFFGRFGAAASSVLFATVFLGVLGLSWRTSLLIFAGAGIAFAFLFGWLFRDSPAAHPLANSEEARLIAGDEDPTQHATKSVLNWGRALSSRNVLALVFMQFTCAFVDNVFSNWMPRYLDQVQHVSLSKAGWMTAAPLLGGAVGGLLCGVLQSAWIAKGFSRRWCRSLMGLTGNLLAMVCMLASLAFSDPWAVAACFTILKFFADWAQPTGWATITDIGGRSSATVFAIVNTAGSLAGFVAGPAMGWIIQAFSTGETTDGSGWTALFLILALTYLASALSWLVIDCTKPVEA